MVYQLCRSEQINDVEQFLIVNPDFDIDTLDENGWALIHYAVETGNLDLVNLLIKRGADVNLLNDSSYSPFHVMIESQSFSTELIALLIGAGAQVGSSLHKAVLLSDQDQVERLVQIDDYLFTKDQLGNTPLHHSVALNLIQITKILLDAGAEVNASDIFGTTALHIAAADGYIEQLDLLLQNGADLHAIDYNGRTSLIFASGNACEKGVLPLINGGSLVNHQDKFDNTALHYAFENSELLIAQFLIDNGADPAIMNKEGKTPFDLMPS